MPAKGSGRIPTCHPEREHKAKGLCLSCYNTQLIKSPEAYAKHRARVKAWQDRNPGWRK